VYLWTLTRDASSAGRPPDEFKIQLILPALMQGRGARGSLDLEDVEVTLLLGFSPELGVFCAWEASRYTDFAYSANAQVKEALLLEAQESGWAVAEPRPKKGQEPEVRVAFTPGNLPHFIKVAKEADDKGLVADDRMNWFLRQAPDLAGEPRLPRGAPPEPSEQIRAKRLTLRLERDRKFAVTVRKEYGSACVVCGLQLEIVEGAHIIPAGETGGVDEGWNGLCYARLTIGCLMPRVRLGLQPRFSW
ncbi:MAG: hypothetical protein LC118_09450, partial [Dehalococcoidia bacterium]|nr:hypothetical protein [Dehalococcoidia bacterium]